MAFQFDDSPEELVRLRDTVKVWLDKAVAAVYSFDQEDNGVFKLSSDQNNNQQFNLTTNARCYMALIYAFRVLDDKKGYDKLETRFSYFLFKLYSSDKEIGSDINCNFKLAHFIDLVFVEQFLREYHNGAVESTSEDAEEKCTFEESILGHVSNPSEKFKKWLENFGKSTGVVDDNNNTNNGNEDAVSRDIISKLCGRMDSCYDQEHKADIDSIKNKLEDSLILGWLNNKSGGKELDPHEELKMILGSLNEDQSDEKDKIKKFIEKYLPDSVEGDRSKQDQENYQMEFLKDESDSRHFFVTLHALRAISILSPEKPAVTEFQEKCAKHAEMFCREQYSYRHGKKHCQDIFRLVFAITIYAIYEKHPDKNLIKDVIEIISDTQQAGGNWPSTHPIPRTNKKPWYITTHEIPLCLTWLYFQPRVPDAARPLLLQMMEKYFSGWVIPTYQRIHYYKGWFDESLNGKNEVTGWATGVVCHFLANYCAVLNDHINRRVIESLNLQACSDRYLIDETAIDRNLKWDNCYNNKDYENDKRPIWPDLQPYIWSQKNEKKIAKTIQWEWTDPTDNAELSRRLAKHVIFNILKNPQSRPDKYVAGVLDGPPGTRKTTLVKTLSKIMRWPLISVPASVIFEKGFDQAETQASAVFRMLNYLTGCVIFFDEFEEFMRARLDNAIIHDRTIAAFMTSAMLPRFQDLHDKKYCLIFLATNHSEKIDEAIVRPGRFDFKETIDYPNISRFIVKGEGEVEGDYLNVKNLTKITLNKMRCETNDTEMTINKSEDKKRIAVIVKAVREALDSIIGLKTIKFEIIEAVLDEVNKWYMGPDGCKSCNKECQEAIKGEARDFLMKEIEASDEKGHGPQGLPPL